MTPSELNTYCRQRYNATADNFFSDTELYSYMYDAQMQLARETKCIKAVYSSSTVASQNEYDKPSRSVSIKRVTYGGKKLVKINDKLDDYLTGGDQDTTSTGEPQYYWDWGTTIHLRPTPDAIGTLKIYSFDVPDTVLATGTFNVPLRYHLDLADFVLFMMALKDKNFDVAAIYERSWQTKLSNAKRYESKLARGDAWEGVIPECLGYDIEVL